MGQMRVADGPEQVAPFAAHLHAGLVDVPTIPEHVQSGPFGVGELRREALDLSSDRDVVDLDALSARSSSTSR